jgi:hypothetical protein
LSALLGKTENAATARAKYQVAAPRFTDDEKDALTEDVLTDAMDLTMCVRDEEPAVVWGALTQYSHAQLIMLAVVLAAMVPPDRSVSDLLGWVSMWAEVA